MALLVVFRGGLRLDGPRRLELAGAGEGGRAVRGERAVREALRVRRSGLPSGVIVLHVDVSSIFIHPADLIFAEPPRLWLDTKHPVELRL